MDTRKISCERVCGCAMYSSGSGLEPVAGCCEHGNRPSDSIKGGELLDQPSVVLAPQDGPCSVQLGNVVDT
jgi:hypothetical protein